MRIAYFLTWHDGVGRGVLDKVNEQVGFWESAGREVGVFMVVDHNSSDVSGQSNHEISTQTYGSALASLLAQIRALRELKSFAPDIIYLRPSLRNLWLLRFFPSIPLVAEIQTNDLLESKLTSRFRFLLTWVLRRSLKRAHGLVFVSHELAEAPEFADFSLTRVAIGNGIDLSRVRRAGSRSTGGPPSLLFVGSSDDRWQGIDHLLSFAQENPGWSFHIVGGIPPVSEVPPNVVFHGTKDAVSILEIAENADLGIGTLGLHRKGMNEASPLKVRHYLALGLPVVGAYQDTDIEPACDFFLQIPNEPNSLSLSRDLIEDFAYKWRGKRVDRTRVASIDSSAKEALRLQFLDRVLNE